MRYKRSSQTINDTTRDFLSFPLFFFCGMKCIHITYINKPYELYEVNEDLFSF